MWSERFQSTKSSKVQCSHLQINPVITNILLEFNIYPDINCESRSRNRWHSRHSIQDWLFRVKCILITIIVKKNNSYTAHCWFCLGLSLKRKRYIKFNFLLDKHLTNLFLKCKYIVYAYTCAYGESNRHIILFAVNNPLGQLGIYAL